jgi:hypothetical protein
MALSVAKYNNQMNPLLEGTLGDHFAGIAQIRRDQARTVAL